MKAKKTVYNGYEFRSKLEAKWAVFFDLCGIKYDYEPEAFICFDGSQYTPDFYLHDVKLRSDFVNGVYVEIKPQGYNDSDHKYQERISSAVDTLIVLVGDPVYSTDQTENPNYQYSPIWDNGMVLLYCDNCNEYKFDYGVSSKYRCNKCNCCMSDGGMYNSKIRSNASIARKYKFEYVPI